MAAAVVGAGRLFIALQRLDRRDPFFAPNNIAYIAVFDIETDEEIDTGRDPMLKGIPLAIRNPNNDLVVIDADNALYVQGVGDYQGASSGGVERIDLTTYASRVVVADDAAGRTHGKTAAMAIASPSKGYLVGYAGFSDTTLFSFDPGTGAVGPAVDPAFTSIDIADISIGPAGNLWVSDSSSATVHVLDTATDTVVDTVVTNLNPQQVAFFAVP
jgi:YVTN family beta-propeller protein